MKNKLAIGYISAFSAYLIWGLLPVYWKQLKGIDAVNLLAIRVTMTVMTLFLVILIRKKYDFITYLKNPKIRKSLILSSLFIGVNWMVFVYAINSNQLVQASLGYYINPLLSIALGIVFMKEKLSRIQFLAIGLAFAGVMYLTIGYGVFPWISLILALSFGLYGLMKKVYQLDSMNSLMLEGAIILPIIWVMLLIQGEVPTWLTNSSGIQWMLILIAGLVTVVPLILFAEGAKRIPLSAIGFLQYIAPTLMLVIGVLLYGEAFTKEHLVAFAFIWSGLAVYSYSVVRKLRSS